MYNIEKISNRIYRDAPWNISVEDRLAKITGAKKNGKRTVGYIYPQFDSSTFRYRGYNVCESLDYSFEWGGAWFQLNELDCIKKNISEFDLIILIRCPWTEKLEDFVRGVKKYGLIVGYDIDDLVYKPKYFEYLAAALGFSQDYEYNFWHGLMYRNEKCIELCDSLITTNEYLADYLRKDFDKQCYVIPNYLNMLQQEVSDEYLRAKMSLKSEDYYEIGYFSGSPTHAKDLQVALPAIETFFNENKNARLKIVGYMEIADKYSYLVNEGRIIFKPFTSMTGLQYEQATVDVNIVPLLNNVFSNCKSELKYFESAIVGTATLATPTYAYAHAIEYGDNGYLCNNEEEWYANLRKVYEKPFTDKDMLSLSQKSLDKYSSIRMTMWVENILEKIVEIK
ncbi:MAG: hypothetical protein MJ104_01490 [Lachnospiraceae bacterium]|nr:hypothetical protein [Lachnospiraceae bacterium]